MSQVIFNNRISMPLAATPSVGGYTVGYDLDGVIKQKDAAGVVTPLFTSSSQTLSQTLFLGSDSGIYSIMMGTSSSIYSSAAKNQIRLNHNGGLLISSTASGVTASLLLATSSATLASISSSGSSVARFQASTYSVSASTSTQSVSFVQNQKSVSITLSDTHAGVSSVRALNIGSSYDSDGISNKSFVHINAKNATTNAGVANSVVIGGDGLVASVSGTVYLGNVNINNEYTLPVADGTSGQVIVTDGSGVASWSSISSITAPLDQVLAVGNNSNSYSIIMGTNTGIFSANGGSSIYLDHLSTVGKILISSDGSAMEKAYISINQSDFQIGATSGTVTIGDRKGLRYSEDYSSTFVANSLVTKQYVDSLSSSTFLTYRIAYVDPFNGTDSTGILNRVDKPYRTAGSASSALQAAYSLSPLDQGLVHMKKGVYSESVLLKDNIVFYCEPGVVFSGNGFTDLGSVSGVKSKVLGYADFITAVNTNLVPLDITMPSTVEFEFGKIDNISVAFKVSNLTGTSNVKIKGKSAKTISTLGRGILIGNQAGTSAVSSNVSIELSESISSAYDTIDIRPLFSGIVDIKCPSITCDADLNSITGPQAGSQHALSIRSSSAKVGIIGNLYETTSSFSGGNNSCVYVNGCDLSIVGSIDGGNCPGILAEGSGTFSVFGNILSKRESVINSSNGLSMKISDSMLKTQGSGTVPYAIDINSGSMSSIHLNSCRIYNSVQNSGLIVLSSTSSLVTVCNSLAYSPGTASGNFIFCAGTASVGIHNTRCNKDNSENIEDTFAPSGFIYDDKFYMEGF